MFLYNQIVGVSFYEDYSLNTLGSTFRVSIMVYHQNKEQLKSYKYFFVREQDFKGASLRLNSINYTHRNMKKRNL